MIIDCFPFFNEKEIFELRYNLLKDKVDCFIVTEGDHTHRGKPKELIFEKILQELGISDKRIIYVPVKMPSYEENKDPWVRERMQRDAAAKFIHEGDIAIISDCDEIINPEFIDYYVSVARANPFNILRIPMAFLCSRADLRVHDPEGNPIPWRTPFIVMKNHLRDYTLSRIRESHALSKNDIRYKDIFTIDGGVIVDAGWHLSWMGDLDRIKTKEESFLHWDEVSVKNLNVTAGTVDLLGRHDHIMHDYDKVNLPKQFFEIERVRQFLFQEKKEKTLISILEEDPFITTDKNTVCYTKHNDKWMFLQYHSYIENFYEEAFRPYRDKENSILEIGVDTGGSMALWSKYFSHSKILGIDIKTDRFLDQFKDTNYPNIRNIIVTDAYDQLLVDFLPEFDIIIDDGPHWIEYQLKGIDLYLPKLKVGGLMVIEDVEDIKNIEALSKAIPNNGMYETHAYDLRDIDKRYDSIIFSIKRVK
jgi:hypothetical protein